MSTIDVIEVLDHGHVRLVDHMGNDLSIVRSARVSYQADWRTGEDAGKDEKLIHYLMTHRHTTPFESVQFTFEVKAPIFVFRQWHRHRMWSYNEISARYSELPQEYYIPKPEIVGKQSSSNKQGRDVSDIDQTLALTAYAQQCDQAFHQYQQFLALGWPRELARAVLPVSTYSKMFASVNLHNLFHFLRLRLDAHAQYEIRVYAQAMLYLIEPYVPLAVKAWRTTLPEGFET